MSDFIPMDYMKVEQALDEVGRCLMPDKWLGTETILLKTDSSLVEETPTGEEAVAPDTPVGRLNGALRFLTHALFAGEVSAVIAQDDGVMRPFPSSLWAKPGTRVVFRSGELPVHLRVDLEGHKADAGKRWVLIPRPELHHLLNETRLGAELRDIDTKCHAWLRSRIEQCAEGRLPPKKQLWMEAQALLGPRLTYRTFNRIWSATTRAS